MEGNGLLGKGGVGLEAAWFSMSISWATFCGDGRDWLGAVSEAKRAEDVSEDMLSVLCGGSARDGEMEAVIVSLP